MVLITQRFLKTTTRLLVILTLVSGIAGPRVLTAAQLICEPDCPMHSNSEAAAPCCEIAGDIRHEMDPSYGGGDTLYTASPACCDGKLCFYPRIDFQKAGLLSNGSADTCAEIAKLPVWSAAAIIFPSKQPSHCVFPPETATPVYIRTCVFLI